MRDDMAKVIVERPRIPAFKVRKGRHQPLDDMPTHEGMRRVHALRGDRKTLNENLTPLRRFLGGQVGRPWDKVYSEIAAHLRIDSTVQQHVRDHLHDFVAVKPRRINQGWRSHRRGAVWRQPLYVDPMTGLLCRTDRLPDEKARLRRAKQKTTKPVDRLILTKDRELRLIRDVWYEVQLATLPEPTYKPCQEIERRRLKLFDPHSPIVETEVTVRRLITPSVYDVAAGMLVGAGPQIDNEAHWRDFRKAHPERLYAIAKRTLSRRELRQHGLRATW